MKTVVLVVFGLIVGYGARLVLDAIDHEWILIRIVDNDECSDRKYDIEMSDKWISVKNDQVKTEHMAMALGAEADIIAMPPYDGNEQYAYKFHASYSDCADISTEARTIERGWIVYEFITNGKVEHKVRSR